MRVKIQPTGLTCTVSNGSGTATANVTNVSVSCSSACTLDTFTAGSLTSASTWQGLTYGNGLFVAGAQLGEHLIATSPDGITWTTRTSADEGSFWGKVSYLRM